MIRCPGPEHVAAAKVERFRDGFCGEKLTGFKFPVRWTGRFVERYEDAERTERRVCVPLRCRKCRRISEWEIAGPPPLGAAPPPEISQLQADMLTILMMHQEISAASLHGQLAGARLFTGSRATMMRQLAVLVKKGVVERTAPTLGARYRARLTPARAREKI